MVSRRLLSTVVQLWMVSVSVHALFLANQARRLASENTGNINIDCGADAPTENPKTRIFYSTDGEFVTTGESKKVSSIYNDKVAEVIRYYRDLRSFPEGKRNCYALQTEQGEGKKFLMRASFMYGNYDGKNQIPKFDLYLGVNYWYTVELLSNDHTLYYEIIHVSAEDTINVCLVNTGKGVPFISALELRVLEMSIYSTPSQSQALISDVRWDFGKQVYGNFRYINDPYNRPWKAVETAFLNSITAKGQITMSQSNSSYQVPEEVLATAVEPQNDSRSLNLSYEIRGFRNGYYVFFHFAEIESYKTRAFTISLNNEIYGPFTLEFLKPFSIRPQKSPMIHEDISISINATHGSDHPPIINALEIYGVKELSNLPTNSEHVAAILAIKEKYNIRKEDWQGDPCLPTDYLWSGLNCTLDIPPRIISLNLSSSKLSGDISLWFSNLTAIRSLDLSNNELIGPVPEFLGQLSNLSFLNLSGNKLTGSIPQTLKDKHSGGKLQLSIDRNPGLSMKEASGRNRNVVIKITASISAALALLVLLIPLYFVGKRMKRGGAYISKRSAWMRSKNQIFSYSEIVRITDNFKTLIGEGGFGKVYHGNHKDNQVAVKLISPSSRQGYKEFQAEAQHLTIIHHRNLVSLIGYCDSGENMALVYEYIANKDLKQHLSDKTLKVLAWKHRLQIAADAACGLEYLHNGCKPPILHRDLKPANILLDENMRAKIADFGLSRHFAAESESIVSTCPAGTPGYIDPEAQETGRLNKKSDVYSFGIILLELLTGKPAIIRGNSSNTNIADYVKPAIQRGDIQGIIDRRVWKDFSLSSAWKFVEIAMSCVLPNAIQRPDMNDVTVELKDCLAMEIASSRPTRTVEDLAIDESLIPSPR